MAKKCCPKGSDKRTLLFVEHFSLSPLGFKVLAAIKARLSRTKFQHQSSTDSRELEGRLAKPPP